jgi:hypothetical protein
MPAAQAGETANGLFGPAAMRNNSVRSRHVKDRRRKELVVAFDWEKTSAIATKSSLDDIIEGNGSLSCLVSRSNSDPLADA